MSFGRESIPVEQRTTLTGAMWQDWEVTLTHTVEGGGDEVWKTFGRCPTWATWDLVIHDSLPPNKHLIDECHTIIARKVGSPYAVPPELDKRASPDLAYAEHIAECGPGCLYSEEIQELCDSRLIGGVR